MTRDHRFPETSYRFRTVFVAAVIVTVFPVAVVAAMAAPVAVASIVMGVVAGWTVSRRRPASEGRRRPHYPTGTRPGGHPPAPR
ncbi:MAG: hypothetical protein ABEI31_01920 [Halodesulfurarchaeum sp.]